MAIADIICIAVLALFALVGLIRGFAKQMVTVLGWFFALITALLLVKPTFNLLFVQEGAAFAGVADSFGGILAFCNDIGFINDYAVSLNASWTGGILMARWIILLGIALVLWIVVTIIFKILKLIFNPFAEGDNPIKAVDKILGLVFGAVWGAVLIFFVLLVAYFLKDTVSIVGEYLNEYVIKPDGFVNKYAYFYVNDWLAAFFKGVWDFFASTIV